MEISIQAAGIIGAIASIIGLGFAWRQRGFVLSQDTGNEKMQQIAGAVQRGAQAFLSREYRAVAIFVVLVAVVLVAGFVCGTLVGVTRFTFLDLIQRAVGSIGRQEYALFTLKTLAIGFMVALISCKDALSLSGSATEVLDILPRSFAKSVLAALMISIVLTILL